MCIAIAVVFILGGLAGGVQSEHMTVANYSCETQHIQQQGLRTCHISVQVVPFCIQRKTGSQCVRLSVQQHFDRKRLQSRVWHLATVGTHRKVHFISSRSNLLHSAQGRTVFPWCLLTGLTTSPAGYSQVGL